MLTLQRLRQLPANTQAFVEEIAENLECLYGPATAAEYRATGARQFQAAVHHPHVDALALTDGPNAAALLWSTVRDTVGQISFVHILQPYVGQGFEGRLIREAVRTLRAGGVEGIVSECVTLCPLELKPVFDALGFEPMDRTLMAAPLDASGLAWDGPLDTATCATGDWSKSARIIAEAYANRPERRLHVEVRDSASAAAFLESTSAGGYGRARPEYIRTLARNGQVVGVAVGCEAGPDTGFVLQLAVCPACRCRGLGRRLLLELAETFRAAGLARIALGVSEENPAKRLYARLGFAPILPVKAYLWWRP